MEEVKDKMDDIISGWNLSWGEGASLALSNSMPIISGWNLSWGEGDETAYRKALVIISGWNLSWGEGVQVCDMVDIQNYIRLESELG